MADVNMTISAELSETTSGKKALLRKVAFIHTTAATADSNATTSFTITGKLLRFVTSGGDPAWNFVLNDGIANIYTSASLSATPTSGALNIHATIPHDGIPLVDQTLLCTVSNMSSTSGTSPTITIIWEESETM